MDSHGARRTTITSIEVVPDGYDADPRTESIVAANKNDPSAQEMLSFASFLYENYAETGPLLAIPSRSPGQIPMIWAAIASELFIAAWKTEKLVK
jgi:hypothetical protein